MTRTALVSGGTGGLGAAVTAHLLDAGWRVVVPWVAPEELERVGTHPNLHLVKADLSDEQQLEEVLAVAADDPGAPLFGVVNLVGGFSSGPRVHETPIGVLDSQFDLNVRTAYSVSQAALPHLIRRGGGSIVCISAAATHNPFSGGASYIASKAAVSALVETMAVEYRDDHIRVNALLPVVIDTPANRAAMPDADTSRWSQPAEVAKVIEFLLSDAGSPITGGLIPVTNVG
ncbi:SDR family NAD(P)-dependent oxidoreductase [Rhodococcus sp. HNM0563]|uniref:SDR family NAD(P)-dependent oxidoreductase n=1 Tax=unclassified Rhodococcus (in: high G+C Gram-positive bacteria) TaxID=192944 RepID=UPI00146F1592|nr:MULTISPECIES: SDR family NAD(P)-dependent oxidoreductase [unclassified Rhodococcus (in: high G+C Gram-positive bacteria)]MCK0090740.1 SDR family NAD(P)-dependent oxidoreductase [Rhodococcus sp. F64268]NLU61934.1 SDR family NAD(P)-dependent oxidoreductase [Rhodococcus sp. HNM0563]